METTRKIQKLKKRSPKKSLGDLEIPTKNIEIIAHALQKKFNLQEKERKYASAKEVLTLLAGGAFLAASIFIPGLGKGLRMFINQNDHYPNKKEWEKFNSAYLAKAIRRLEKQKFIEIEEKDDLKIVKITDRGKRRVLAYALNELDIEKPKIWNGKWYFVTYDIPKGKDWLRKIMRDFLKRLGFYRFHESLYIHAYPCLKEIEFLREYLGLGEYVKVLVVSRIENDRVFRDYFGI